MDKDGVIQLVANNVSRETLLVLEEFVSILTKWNERVNLVSRKLTLTEIWRDHVLDSMLLYPYLTSSGATLLDIGSGAGFPGLILSIMGHEE